MRFESQPGHKRSEAWPTWRCCSAAGCTTTEPISGLKEKTEIP